MNRILAVAAVLVVGAAGYLAYDRYLGDDAYDGERPACTTTVFLGARGSSQESVASEHGMGSEVFGLFSTVSRSAKVAPYGLDYPAAQALSQQYDGSVSDGASTLRAEVADLASRCKDTKVVLAGYSQGAEVVHRAYADLGSDDARNVVAVVLLADPRRDPSDANVTLRSYGATPAPGGLGAQALPAYAKGHVLSVCDSGDVVCNRTSENEGNALAGGGFGTHGAAYEPGTPPSAYAASYVVRALARQ